MIAIKKITRTGNISAILHSLQEHDKTIYEIAEDTGIKPNKVQETISRIVKQYDSIEKKGVVSGSVGRNRIIWGTTEVHKILNRGIV